jgi:hypothetical protein
VAKPILDITERAVSTFLFTFMAVVPTSIVAFDPTTRHALEAGLVTSGFAAGQSLIKNVLAALTAAGNGPDVSSFDDGGADPTPAAPVDPAI